MVTSGKSLNVEPVWYLNSNRLDNVNSLEVLAVIFDNCSFESQKNAGGPFKAFVILTRLTQDYHQMREHIYVCMHVK